MPEGVIGQILAVFLVAIVIVCVMFGVTRGLMYGVFSVVRNILAIAVAIALTPVITKWLPEDFVAKEGIAYAASFLLSWLIFFIVGTLIKKADDAPVIGTMDKFGGAVAGMVIGFLLVWSLLAILGCFQENALCHKIVEEARQNSVVMWFQNYSPLTVVLKQFNFPVL